MKKILKEKTYSVGGMHCASCEILIENKFLTIQGVKSVDASTSKGQVVIEYENQEPKTYDLDRMFKAEGYTFSNQKTESTVKGGLFSSIITALVIVAGFLALNNLGLSSWINVTSGSSLPAFFGLGLLAGVSSCAALVGGLILSMSKQWLTLYSDETSVTKKLQPHLMFNTGRVLSYMFFGSLLGLLGNKFQLSLKFSAYLIIAVSIMMVFLALQMLGVRALRRFQFSLPKSSTRFIADEKNFKGKNMPLLMGALTFFLPCGFTLTSQGLALLSGSPLQGALIMGFFALGTAIPLLAIGLSSVKLSQKPHLAYKFSKIAGVIILFFALFNINSQMNVLGYTSFSDIKINNTATKNISGDDLPAIVDGKQVIKMTAYASKDSPDYFKVRVGVPVRWEITAGSSLGCNNGIISTNLFEGSISLTPNQLTVKEFTPTKAGRYKFSCWMGMISGVIEVVDSSAPASAADVNIASTATDNDVVPSGASGCGCGGGGSGSCGINK